MHSGNSTIIAQKENLRIVRFEACGHISFMYNNLLLNFSDESFRDFSEGFGDIDFDNRAATFPDGNRRLVMNTCRKEIQLCFERSEFNLVKDALTEASLMLEVNEILASPEN